MDNIMQLYNNKTINIIKFLIKLGYSDDRLKDILYRNIKKNIKTFGEITFRDEDMNFIVGFENTFNSLTINELELNYLSSKEVVPKDCKWYKNKVNGFNYRYTPDYIESIDDQFNYTINQITQNDKNLYNQLSSQYDILTQEQLDQFNSNLNSFTKSIKKQINTIMASYNEYKETGNKEFFFNTIENEITIISQFTKTFINNTSLSLTNIITNSSLSEEDKEYIQFELEKNTSTNEDLLKYLIQEIESIIESYSGSYSSLKIHIYELGSYIKSNYPNHKLECNIHPQLRKFFRLGYKENKCINDYTFLNSFSLVFDKNIIKILQKKY
jgi:hypothetical protein